MRAVALISSYYFPGMGMGMGHQIHYLSWQKQQQDCKLFQHLGHIPLQGIMLSGHHNEYLPTCIILILITLYPSAVNSK